MSKYTAQELGEISENLSRSTDASTGVIAAEREKYKKFIVEQGFESQQEELIKKFDEDVPKAIIAGAEKGAKPSQLDDEAKDKEESQKSGFANSISGIFSMVGSKLIPFFDIAWSFIQNIPVVGDMISGLAESSMEMFSGKDEKERAFEKQTAGAAVAVAELNFPVGDATFKISNPQLIADTITNARTNGLLVKDFASFDKDGDQAVSGDELKKLDKSGDNQLTRDEIPEALKTQFDEMLKKRPVAEGESVPLALDLGNLSAPISLNDFKPQQTSVASK